MFAFERLASFFCTLVVTPLRPSSASISASDGHMSSQQQILRVYIGISDVVDPSLAVLRACRLACRDLPEIQP